MLHTTLNLINGNSKNYSRLNPLTQKAFAAGYREDDPIPLTFVLDAVGLANTIECLVNKLLEGREVGLTFLREFALAVQKEDPNLTRLGSTDVDVRSSSLEWAAWLFRGLLNE